MYIEGERKMIIRDSPRYFKTFFYSGLNGANDENNVLDYILYQSTSEMHDIYDRLEKLYNSSNEEQKQRIHSIASEYYKQYYRFIIVNNDPEKYTYKNKEENLIVKTKIDDTLTLWIKNGNLNFSAAGIFVSGSKEDAFLEIKKLSREEKDEGWVDIVFRLLRDLKKLEQVNPEKYEMKWLETKLARAFNRKNETEIANTEDLIKKFKENQSNREEMMEER